MLEEQFESMMERKADAGYQKRLNRATFQGPTLSGYTREGIPAGDYVSALRAWGAGDDGRVKNEFVNLNRGLGGPKLWHKDNPTEGTLIRMLCYLQQMDMEASLGVRYDEELQIFIRVPRGCALACTRYLLESLEHAHGANGACISICLEVDRPLPAPSSAAEIAAASAAQPELALEEHLGAPSNEAFKAMFEGACRKGGHGGGSVRRNAVSAVAGPKLGRGQHRPYGTMKAARAAVAAMSEAEQAAMASSTYVPNVVHSYGEPAVPGARVTPEALQALAAGAPPPSFTRPILEEAERQGREKRNAAKRAHRQAAKRAKAKASASAST